MVQTTGRWPWKLESAKECVTTHLSNHTAPKMDGAQTVINLLPDTQPSLLSLLLLKA